MYMFCLHAAYTIKLHSTDSTKNNTRLVWSKMFIQISFSLKPSQFQQHVFKMTFSLITLYSVKGIHYSSHLIDSLEKRGNKVSFHWFYGQYLSIYGYIYFYIMYINVSLG